MEYILFTLILIVLFVLVIQDLLSRAVFWVLMPVLFTCLLFYYPTSYHYPLMLLQKFAFLLLILLLLTIYIKLRKGTAVSVTESYFGWGDILFLVALLPFGSVFGYLTLVVSGTVFTLVFHLLILLFKFKSKTIPYVGYFALFFSAILMVEIVSPNLIKAIFYG